MALNGRSLATRVGAGCRIGTGLTIEPRLPLIALDSHFALRTRVSSLALMARGALAPARTKVGSESIHSVFTASTHPPRAQFVATGDRRTRNKTTTTQAIGELLAAAKMSAIVDELETDGEPAARTAEAAADAAAEVISAATAEGSTVGGSSRCFSFLRSNYILRLDIWGKLTAIFIPQQATASCGQYGRQSQVHPISTARTVYRAMSKTLILPRHFDERAPSPIIQSRRTSEPITAPTRPCAAAQSSRTGFPTRRAVSPGPAGNVIPNPDITDPFVPVVLEPDYSAIYEVRKALFSIVLAATSPRLILMLVHDDGHLQRLDEALLSLHEPLGIFPLPDIPVQLSFLIILVQRDGLVQHAEGSAGAGPSLVVEWLFDLVEDVYVVAFEDDEIDEEEDGGDCREDAWPHGVELGR